MRITKSKQSTVSLESETPCMLDREGFLRKQVGFICKMTISSLYVHYFNDLVSLKLLVY